MSSPGEILRPIRNCALAGFAMITLGSALLSWRTDDAEVAYVIWFVASVLLLFLVCGFAVVRGLVYRRARRATVTRSNA